MKKSYITVTDQFCGAGGSSIGAKKAGAEIFLALNHWTLAVESHNTNFPDTHHDCVDVSAVNPRRYPSTTFLITSPECTSHTYSDGRHKPMQPDLFGENGPKPEDERSRATMWDVPRFAEFHRYECIIVENVVEARKWQLFDTWLQAMRVLGYAYKIVYFNSMFAWPTPQSRDRMYVVFWRHGNKAPDLDIRPPAFCTVCERDVAAVQSWKKTSFPWGRYGERRQYVYLCPTCANQVEPYYYCAFNVVDWSIASERIGDRKRPLKPKTLKRIRLGLEKYGRQLLLVQLAYSHDNHNRSTPMFEPFPTQTGRQTVAFVVSMRSGEPKYVNGYSLTQPLPTTTTIGAPYLVELHGSSTAHAMTNPLPCVLAGGGHTGIVYPQPFLIGYYGTGDNAHSLAEPLPTQTTHHRHAVLSLGEPFNGDLPAIDDLYFRMLRSHEIGLGMAFPSDYQVLGTERERVRQYGQAVTPPVMKMLFDRCVATLH